jgi:hypothetical protein
MSELADVMFKASAALASLAQAVELQSFTTKEEPEYSNAMPQAFGALAHTIDYPHAVPQAFSALVHTVDYGPSEILKFEDSLRVDNSVTVDLQSVTPTDLTKGTQERALKVLADVTCSAFTGLQFIVTITGTTCLLFAKWKDVCSPSGAPKTLTSRKYYISPHMLDDEIVQTGFLCLKTALEHEFRETFKVQGKAIFSPHLSHAQLATIETKERN